MKTNIIASLLLWPVVAGLTVALYLSGALLNFEYMSYDWRMKMFNADKRAPSDVAIIMIDEPSMAYMEPMAGRWPWPRSVHADLIEVLAGFAPRAVLFDMIFPERDLRDAGADGVSPHDQRLVEESANNDFVVHAIHFEGDLDHPADPAIFDKAIATADAGPLRDWSLSHDDQNMIAPFPPLDRAAVRIGVVSADPDQDGVYRRTHLLHYQQGHIYPALSVAGLLSGAESGVMADQTGGLVIAGHEVPVAADSSYLVNHYGKITTYPYSLLISTRKKLLDGDIENLQLDPSELQNKILFIGTNATGLFDLKQTPLDNSSPGVYIHASVAGNILSGDFLRSTGRPFTLATILLLSMLCVGATLWHGRPLLRLVISPLLIALYVFAAVWLFSANMVIDMVAPLLSAGLSWGGSFLYLSFTEGREKRRIRRMFAQYVSPAILSEMEQRHQDFLNAEVGSRENLTILFSDIRNFTAISESMAAERVVEMLNTYIARMNDAIFMFEGTIDKYIGDAVMAFWGAPIRTDQHAIQAVMAAMRMIRYLPEVNEELVQRGYEPLAIGIGLNTGEVVLGNIGSDKKLNYTVIGDNVNLASRLEGLTKQYDCPIMISEYTRNQVCQTIPCRVLDLVRVKGKQHPIRLYAPIIADSDEQIDQAFALCDAHEQAFTAYLQRDWQAALTQYQDLPEDHARNLMMERCRVYLRDQPDAHWDGVFTMKTK